MLGSRRQISSNFKIRVLHDVAAGSCPESVYQTACVTAKTVILVATSTTFL